MTKDDIKQLSSLKFKLIALEKGENTCYIVKSFLKAKENIMGLWTSKAEKRQQQQQEEERKSKEILLETKLKNLSDDPDKVKINAYCQKLFDYLVTCNKGFVYETDKLKQAKIEPPYEERRRIKYVAENFFILALEIDSALLTCSDNQGLGAQIHALNFSAELYLKITLNKYHLIHGLPCMKEALNYKK